MTAETAGPDGVPVPVAGALTIADLEGRLGGLRGREAAVPVLAEVQGVTYPVAQVSVSFIGIFVACLTAGQQPFTAAGLARALAHMREENGFRRGRKVVLRAGDVMVPLVRAAHREATAGGAAHLLLSGGPR